MKRLAIALAIALMLSSGIIPSAGLAQTSDGFGFDRYHDYGEIKAELERLAADHPDIAELAVIGRTWEGRDIMALRITDNPETEEADEPSVLIMGAHHGNELPSAEVPMHMLRHLAENYDADWRIRELVDSRDIWFVPLVNPDGREHALDADETWRKNRRPIDLDGDGGADGTGADINRNYGHLWGELPGASHDIADRTYCGPAAFSENETRAIRDLALNQDFSISLSYHTYGDVIYHPWNNGIDTVSPDGALLESLAGRMAELSGYAPMQGIDAYPTTGDSDDWLYADTDCLPFTIEMGTVFAPPPADVENLFLENLDAALLAIEYADPGERTLPDWTVMAYMSADADQALADEALVDLNEMEVVGSGPAMNIVCLFDGMDDGDSMILHVQKDPGGYNSNIISPVVDDGSAITDPGVRELEMSNATLLRQFVAWATENYPARHFLLVFWGHGDGVLEGFIPDRGVPMMVGDIHAALEGFDLDIVGFDTCSMGHFEVAAELVGIADMMIGSEAKEPLSGWDYDTSLGKLAASPLMEPEDLATHIVSDYLASTSATYKTQAAIDLHVFGEEFMPLLDEFVQVSIDFMQWDHSKVWPARNVTDTFVFEANAVDLFEYLGNLKAENATANVLARIERMQGIGERMIIASGSGVAHPDSLAMAVYFPPAATALSTAYSELGFGSLWNDYLTSARDPETRPMIRSTTPTEVNTTLMPYPVTAVISDAPPEPDIILFYRLNGGFWNTNNMIASGGNLVSGSDHPILSQHNGTLIEYYFLDALYNITEPYEVKWGSGDYLSFIVNATCDIAITGIELVQPGEPQAGDTLTFAVNCTNLGPSLVTAKIRFTVFSTTGGQVGRNETADAILMPGENITISFNWTALPGNWTVRAALDWADVFDDDPDNQDEHLNILVPGTLPGGSTFFEDYWLPLVLLSLAWSVAIVAIMHVLRKGRRRRREGVERSMASARQFLSEAEGFGADTQEAKLMLARAEAALAAGKYPEAERLVSGARESALGTIGRSAEHPGMGGGRA